jgi:hypothetical protein
MSWKDDLNYGLAAFGLKLPDGLPLDQWALKLDQSPCRNTAAVVGASSALFYLLERGHNPKVNDVFDAMVYTSTCLSVGYGDIFAKTPLGKLLGSTLMTIGPALSSKALDGPAAERRDAVQTEVLETLKQILRRLETPAAPNATSTDHP